MKRFVFLLTFCIFILTSCSNVPISDNVSREEYQSVVSEVDELKSQIESMQNDKGDTNVEMSDSTNNTENLESVVPDEEYSKERTWLRDFSFEYDENNKIYISLYQEGERNLYLNGYGVYEEENLGLLQYDRKSICSFLELLAGEGHSIDMIFTVGEDEYLLIFNEGELISDTVPIEGTNWSLPPEKYSDKIGNALKQFMDFIHNE